MTESLRKHHRTLTLRVSILTLFLSLFSISFTFVILFGYFKNYNAIMNFSLGTVERSSGLVLEKVKDFVSDSIKVPQVTEAFLVNSDEFSFTKGLINYMISIDKNYEAISSIFLAKENGDLLSVSLLSDSFQTNFMSDPSKPLPKEAVYSVLRVDLTKSPPTNTWDYINANLEIIAHEEIDKDIYDPRTRPWYEGAIKAKDFYWSDFFTFFPTGDTAITVSKTITNIQKKFLGVIGTEITLKRLSQFISSQTIGKTGKVFILDGSGKIIVPSENSIGDKFLRASKEAAHEAYKEYKSNNQQSLIFTSNGVKYLVRIDKIPVVSGKEWLIIVVAPHLDFFEELLNTQIETILIALLVLIVSSMMVVYFSKKISTPIVTLSKEVDKITHLDLSSVDRLRSNIKEIILMDTSVDSMRLALRSFGRFIPKKIVGYLLEQGKEITLGGEKKEVTIFFSDVKEFTAIAENYPTERLMTFLEEYYNGLSKIILEQQGTIDKYIGDSVMVFWGAPLDQPDHAIKACLTALYCQAFISQFNEKQRKENNPEFFTRIGINTGNVIVGNIGTTERMNYTIIGDAVNTASRLEQTNKIYQTKIIVSENTHKLIKDHFLFRPLDIIEVKGKKEKIKIYELLGLTQGDKTICVKPEEIELSELFSKAFETFQAGDVIKAKSLFQIINQKFPNDMPTQIYLNRIDQT